MKSLLLCLVLTGTFATAVAQTTINGRIVDNKNEPIPGANILVQDSYDGTSSAADGSFQFKTEEAGERTLIIRFIGYAEHRQPINLQGKTIELTVELKEEINELEAVTITAGAFTASDASRRTVFKPVDIATTAGATADIAGALNTLPGTQKVGETGRLFVRGGDGSETRTFIDGMAVLEAYGPSAPNAPSRSRFLPFMFKGTSFSTGGYSAEYGQALSSALVLESKDEAETKRTDIGILSVGGDVAHTHAWDGGSVTGKVQYTNIRPYFGLINQEIDWKKAPASIEAVGAFRQRTGKDGMIKLYGNFNESDLAIYNHDIDNYDIKTLYDLKNRYRYVNGSYKTSLNKDWSLRSGISYSFVQNDVDNDFGNTLETEKGLHAKAVAEGSLSSSVELKAGAEAIYRNYDYAIDFAPGSSGFTENVTAVFGEGDFRVGNDFIVRAGGRGEHNSLTGELSVDPRASLAYKIKGGQLSFAYGTFRQSVRNEFVRKNNELKPEKAQHYILNYQYVKDKKTFRVETYYKKYDDLIKITGADLNNDGSGYAKGVEFFWRDNATVKGVDYWVSYSFLDTERDYLQFPGKATPYFASRHNFSIVGKYFIQAWKSQLGATWSYASGRPYNNPNDETFNASRTPSYQDLSFNWSYLPKPHLILYFSCTNLLGHDNIFGYEFSNVRNTEGLYNGRAIRQAAPRFVFLGIFITLSKNKSFNQLPSL
jgi:hypothetical protein